MLHNSQTKNSTCKYPFVNFAPNGLMYLSAKLQAEIKQKNDSFAFVNLTYSASNKCIALIFTQKYLKHNSFPINRNSQTCITDFLNYFDLKIIGKYPAIYKDDTDFFDTKGSWIVPLDYKL